MNQHLAYYFQKWTSLGIVIYPILPNNLKIRASETALTQVLQNEIQSFKADILLWFEWLQALHEAYEERAAIMEFDGKYSRNEAEHWAKLEALNDYIRSKHPLILYEFNKILEKSSKQ